MNSTDLRATSFYTSGEQKTQQKSGNDRKCGTIKRTFADMADSFFSRTTMEEKKKTSRDLLER